MPIRGLGSVILVLLLSGLSHAAPSRSPRLLALAARLAAHQAGAEDAFWRQLAAEGTPIVEDVHDPGHLLVSFVWRGDGAAHRIQVPRRARSRAR